MTFKVKDGISIAGTTFVDGSRNITIGTLNGNTPIHSGNYSSYAAPSSHTHDYLPLSGGTIAGQLNVNNAGSATAVMRLWSAGSTIWSVGVGDSSGTNFNISADFGSLLVNKSSGNVTTPGQFYAGSSNLVLHLGNKDNYTYPPASHDHSRIGWTGTRTAESGTTNSTPSGFFEMVGAYNNGWPATYGNVLSANGGGAGQLYMGWIGGSGAETGELYYRSMTDWRTNWGSWRRIITDANYNSYSPTLTGTGASGTWGINITGNAATATSATDSTKLPLTGGTITGPTYISTGGNYPLQLISTQRYMLQIRNSNNSVNSGYGWWFATDTNFNFAMHADGLGDVLTLTRSGALTLNGNTALHAGNYNSYALPIGGGTLTGNLNIVGGRVTASTGGTNTYGIFSGYENNNHFIACRASVTGSVTSPSFAGSHQQTFVEYAEANDSTGWYFKSSQPGTYTEVARITRSQINWNGNTVLHAGNYSSYALPIGGGTITGNRPIELDTNGGSILIKGDSGGWGMGLYFRGSDNVVKGSFGALGGGASFSYLWAGLDYANPWMTFTSGQVNSTVALTQGNNQVLHAGNYTGFSSIFRALGAPSGSNDWNGLGNTYANSVIQVDPSNFSSTSNGPTAASYTYGTLLNFTTNSNSQSQIFISHAGNDLIFRGGWGGASWQTWNKALTNINYNSYSPTLTGGNASGTWGINITGNAATATSSSQLNSYYSSSYSGPTSAVKQFFWDNLSANGGQARTFEIARLGIDYNDWNSGIGPFEVELYESYYSRGLKKKYVIYWGYSNVYGMQLVEYSGNGDNNFQVRIGTPVQVSGDNYYLPVFVDVRYYSYVDVRVTTNRDITASNPPGTGSTYINAAPSATNISDFSADSTVNFASTTAVQVAGNQLLHAGNYSSYALPLSGGTISGNLTMNGPGSSTSIIFGDSSKRINVEGYWMMFKGHENEGFRWQTAGQDGATYTTRMQLTSSALTMNGNTVLHASNYSSYAVPYSGGTLSGTWYFNTSAGGTSGALASPALQAYSTGNNAAWFSWHKAGHYAVNMGLDSDNVIRIGGWSAAANRWQLDMSGNGTYAGNVTAYSDERLKKDWAPVQTDFITELAKVKSGTYTRTDSEQRQAGVSAQDFQKLLPETVSEDNAGTLSLAYGNAALVSAVELAKEVIDLRAQVTELRALIITLINKDLS